MGCTFLYYSTTTLVLHPKVETIEVDLSKRDQCERPKEHDPLPSSRAGRSSRFCRPTLTHLLTSSPPHLLTLSRSPHSPHALLTLSSLTSRSPYSPHALLTLLTLSLLTTRSPHALLTHLTLSLLTTRSSHALLTHLTLSSLSSRSPHSPHALLTLLALSSRSPCSPYMLVLRPQHAQTHAQKTQSPTCASVCTCTEATHTCTSPHVCAYMCACSSPLVTHLHTSGLQRR